MTAETYRNTMSIAFKNWHNLAAGAILLALSVYLTSIASESLRPTQTALAGWVMLIVAGYAFVAAIFLGASPLSSSKTLTETVPGIFDHFKSFIVGGVLYAIGTFLAAVEVRNILAPEQALYFAIASFAGAVLMLIAVLLAIAAVFNKPKE